MNFPTRHDVVLAALPTSLLTGAAVGALSTATFALSLATAALLATGPLAWALFVNPP